MLIILKKLKEHKNKIILLISIIIFIYVYIESALNVRAQLTKQYEDACNKLENGAYQEAIDIFTTLGDYKDSLENIEIAKGYIINNLQSNDNEAPNDNQLAQDNTIKLQQLVYSNTISAGIRYSAGLYGDGHVYFSGENTNLKNELDNWSEIMSISVCGHLVVGLKNDGTVIYAGKIPNSDYRIDTSTWEDIISISAGQQYIVGLRSNGSVVAQGHNGDHQIDIEAWNDYNIVAIATGWRHTVGLDSNGDVHILGYHSESQETKIRDNKEKWTDIVAISAGGGSNDGEGKGEAHTVALKSDKTVVAVGNNDHGQCNVGKEYGWEDIIAISAGDFHTVGLKENGTVVTTQIGDSANEISSWKNIVAISAGNGFTLGLTKDGKVLHAGYDKNGQCNTDDWENIIIRKEWKYFFNSN